MKPNFKGEITRKLSNYIKEPAEMVGGTAKKGTANMYKVVKNVTLSKEQAIIWKVKKEWTHIYDENLKYQKGEEGYSE